MKNATEFVDAALEFGAAYYVECIIWGIIIASSATMCALTYAFNPTI